LSAYQILLALPLIYYTAMAFKNGEWQLPKSAWILLAFTVVALISLVLNHDLLPKPGKNYGRLKYFLFGICGIFVLRVWLQEASAKTKKIVASTFLVSLIVAGLVALYLFFFSGQARVRGLTDTMRYGYGSAMAL